MPLCRSVFVFVSVYRLMIHPLSCGQNVIYITLSSYSKCMARRPASHAGGIVVGHSSVTLSNTTSIGWEEK